MLFQILNIHIYYSRKEAFYTLQAIDCLNESSLEQLYFVLSIAMIQFTP